jgi:hypothetical protein
MVYRAGIAKSYPGWAASSRPGRDILLLGRVCPGMGLLASSPRLGRPICPGLSPGGPAFLHPGVGRHLFPGGPRSLSRPAGLFPLPSWAGVLTGPAPLPGWASAQAGLPPVCPRLGLLSRAPAGPWTGCPGWAVWPAAPRLPPARPGWAGLGESGLAGNPLQAASLQPRLGRVRLFRLGQVGAPLAQAGLSPCRPNFTSPGRDLLPPGHIPRPASPPAPCASPGMPPGSDWHFLHRHMLVLGRPLAQTSISILS